MANKTKKEKRERRHRRVRAKIFGTSRVPRLCLFRSSRHIYVQLIDDEKNRVLLEEHTLPGAVKKKKGAREKKIKKTEKAYQLGKMIAQKAKEKKIKKVVFDRAGYKYHGIVKRLAEGAREGGLEF